MAGQHYWHPSVGPHVASTSRHNILQVARLFNGVDPTPVPVPADFDASNSWDPYAVFKISASSDVKCQSVLFEHRLSHAQVLLVRDCLRQIVRLEPRQVYLSPTFSRLAELMFCDGHRYPRGTAFRIRQWSKDIMRNLASDGRFYQSAYFKHIASRKPERIAELLDLVEDVPWVGNAPLPVPPDFDLSKTWDPWVAFSVGQFFHAGLQYNGCALRHCSQDSFGFPREYNRFMQLSLVELDPRAIRESPLLDECARALLCHDHRDEYDHIASIIRRWRAKLPGDPDPRPVPGHAEPHGGNQERTQQQQRPREGHVQEEPGNTFEQAQPNANLQDEQTIRQREMPERLRGDTINQTGERFNGAGRLYLYAPALGLHISSVHRNHLVHLLEALGLDSSSGDQPNIAPSTADLAGTWDPVAVFCGLPVFFPESRCPIFQPRRDLQCLNHPDHEDAPLAKEILTRLIYRTAPYTLRDDEASLRLLAATFLCQEHSQDIIIDLVVDQWRENLPGGSNYHSSANLIHHQEKGRLISAPLLLGLDLYHPERFAGITGLNSAAFAKPRKRATRITPANAAPICDRSHVRRRSVNEECSICRDEEVMGLGSFEDLVWCKDGCGKSFHKECFDGWRETQGKDGVVPPKCVNCKRRWDDDCEHS
ncbi:hypothetical protein EJ08DRAFT_663988 [Tothia fuscella]|uniref:RING-type domain-containing protein n=1 Tax=Tothia fuscella TaxID=1048955 RepID=A0A9P4TU86_9PEZI|nr:hypothetical protein EJ08DRAFT_663988 [Tothia fuscella]